MEELCSYVGKVLLLLEKDICEEAQMHSPEFGGEIYASQRQLLSYRAAPWIILWIVTAIGVGRSLCGDGCSVPWTG